MNPTSEGPFNPPPTLLDEPIPPEHLTYIGHLDGYDLWISDWDDIGTRSLMFSNSTGASNGFGVESFVRIDIRRLMGSFSPCDLEAPPQHIIEYLKTYALLLQ